MERMFTYRQVKFVCPDCRVITKADDERVRYNSHGDIVLYFKNERVSCIVRCSNCNRHHSLRELERMKPWNLPGTMTGFVEEVKSDT